MPATTSKTPVENRNPDGQADAEDDHALHDVRRHVG
jgi:hypothetical protein